MPHTATDPRERLLLAAIEVIDEQPLSKVFSGSSVAAIAERAGVTTGSFFHHFPTTTAFFDALALSFREDSSDIDDTVEELVDALHHIDMFEMVSSALTDTWQIFVADEQLNRRYRVTLQLWAHHHQRLSTPVDGMSTVGDILRQAFNIRQQEGVEGWRWILERTGRAVVEPFDLDRLATALNALFHGLVQRAAVDPDHVDDALFGDVVGALATAVTAPRGSTMRLTDLTVPVHDEAGMSPQARTGARRRRESRARITAAAGNLFADGWERVSASEVAEAAGVSPQTVINLFRSVRTVAATIFSRHLRDLRAAATEDRPSEDGASPHGRTADPDGPLRRTLELLCARVAEDPESARALLGERLEAAMRHRDLLSEHDIRREVPLDDVVASAMSGLDLGGSDPVEVATMLVDFAIGRALCDPAHPQATAALALRLVPDGALT